MKLSKIDPKELRTLDEYNTNDNNKKQKYNFFSKIDGNKVFIPLRYKYLHLHVLFYICSCV